MLLFDTIFFLLPHNLKANAINFEKHNIQIEHRLNLYVAQFELVLFELVAEVNITTLFSLKKKCVRSSLQNFVEWEFSYFQLLQMQLNAIVKSASLIFNINRFIMTKKKLGNRYISCSVQI